MEKLITTDHLKRKLEFSFPPGRIISLVPAITSTLFYLQLENEVVGRTRFCIHPKNFVKKAQQVGGTKEINIEKIRQLKPDIIFAEKEENSKEIVEILENEFPVYVAEVQSIKDVYKMIIDIGTVTNRTPLAEQLVIKIKQAFQSLPHGKNKKVAYCIWKNPYMVVGSNTYINSLLESLGFINVFTEFDERYPVVTEEDFRNFQLDYLFLATEPYPFKEQHVKDFSEILPNTTIKILDGEMFWYGPKMLEAVEYFNYEFKELIND